MVIGFYDGLVEEVRGGVLGDTYALVIGVSDGED